jgi:hypothetical protein
MKMSKYWKSNADKKLGKYLNEDKLESLLEKELGLNKNEDKERASRINMLERVSKSVEHKLSNEKKATIFKNKLNKEMKIDMLATVEEMKRFGRAILKAPKKGEEVTKKKATVFLKKVQGNLKKGAKFCLKKYGSYKAFADEVKYANKIAKDYFDTSVFETSFECGCCNKPLSCEKSRERGYGSKCYSAIQSGIPAEKVRKDFYDNEKKKKQIKLEKKKKESYFDIAKELDKEMKNRGRIEASFTEDLKKEKNRINSGKGNSKLEALLIKELGGEAEFKAFSTRIIEMNVASGKDEDLDVRSEDSFYSAEDD